jgi:hypothetical protein
LPVAAVPVIPVAPDGVLYGFGRIDGSGRVGDRAITGALGWQSGDRLTLTAAAGVIIARRGPDGMVTMPTKPYVMVPAALGRRCWLRPGDRQAHQLQATRECRRGCRPAKSRFRTATHAVPVVRGSSLRPLFITAAGMPSADAADLVRRMAGRYRLPDALRRADTLARTEPPTATMAGCQPADLRRRAERGMSGILRGKVVALRQHLELRNVVNALRFAYRLTRSQNQPAASSK